MFYTSMAMQIVGVEVQMIQIYFSCSLFILKFAIFPVVFLNFKQQQPKWYGESE